MLHQCFAKCTSAKAFLWGRTFLDFAEKSFPQKFQVLLHFMCRTFLLLFLDTTFTSAGKED